MKRGLGGLALSFALVVTAGAGSASAATQVQLGTSPQFSQLVIIGENDVDVVGVSEAGGTITITDQGPGGITTTTPPCATLDPQTVTCPLNPPGSGPVVFLAAVMQGDNDRFLNQNLDVITQAIGGTGNDVLETGPGDDFAQGDVGNDVVDTGPGADQLFWDPGDDEMNGGAGDDEAFFGNSFAPVNASLDDQPNDGPAGEADNLISVESVDGTLFDDVLVGDANANRLFGDNGDDLIVGRGGPDDLDGEDGDDTLNGGDSPDGARDRLDCGLGADLALSDAQDVVEVGCERRGASVTGETAKLRRRGKVKVLVSCPPEEGATCAGTLSLLSNGTVLSKNGSFEVGAGETRNGQLKLTRAGRRALHRSHGSLFVTAQAETVEPGGSSITEARVLLIG